MALLVVDLVADHGLAHLFPRITKAIPSPLVAIVALTLFAVFSGLPLRTVGDMGELPSALPFFALPQIPLAFETLMILLPYALPLALVGLIESLLTANIIDDLTDTGSNKNREARGQGLANIVTGFFGGMAGCAMIGQSIINVSSGGRTRLSTLASGVFLLGMMVALGDLVSVIPMGALVAVMFMVAINTFHWNSLPGMIWHPKSESIVMVGTVGVVLMTHNLALGVGVGVVLDLTHAQLWDATAIAEIDKIVLRFRARDRRVTLHGVNEQGAALLERLAVHDRPGARLGSH